MSTHRIVPLLAILAVLCRTVAQIGTPAPLLPEYTAVVYTGRSWTAGTDSIVKLSLVAEDGNTSRVIVLTAHDGHDTFEPGSVDYFNLTTPHLGFLCGLRVWKINRGLFADWHLDKVVVFDNRTRNMYTFPFFAWIVGTKLSKLPPEAGGWGRWGPWVDCDGASCALGRRYRTRKCDTPPPRCGGTCYSGAGRQVVGDAIEPQAAAVVDGKEMGENTHRRTSPIPPVPKTTKLKVIQSRTSTPSTQADMSRSTKAKANRVMDSSISTPSKQSHMSRSTNAKVIHTRTPPSSAPNTSMSKNVKVVRPMFGLGNLFDIHRKRILDVKTKLKYAPIRWKASEQRAESDATTKSNTYRHTTTGDGVFSTRVRKLVAQTVLNEINNSNITTPYSSDVTTRANIKWYNRNVITRLNSTSYRRDVTQLPIATPYDIERRKTVTSDRRDDSQLNNTSPDNTSYTPGENTSNYRSTDVNYTANNINVGDTNSFYISDVSRLNIKTINNTEGIEYKSVINEFDLTEINTTRISSHVFNFQHGSIYNTDNIDVTSVPSLLSGLYGDNTPSNLNRESSATVPDRSFDDVSVDTLSDMNVFKANMSMSAFRQHNIEDISVKTTSDKNMHTAIMSSSDVMHHSTVVVVDMTTDYSVINGNGLSEYESKSPIVHLSQGQMEDTKMTKATLTPEYPKVLQTDTPNIYASFRAVTSDMVYHEHSDVSKQGGIYHRSLHNSQKHNAADVNVINTGFLRWEISNTTEYDLSDSSQADGFILTNNNLISPSFTDESHITSTNIINQIITEDIGCIGPLCQIDRNKNTYRRDNDVSINLFDLLPSKSIVISSGKQLNSSPFEQMSSVTHRIQSNTAAEQTQILSESVQTNSATVEYIPIPTIHASQVNFAEVDNTHISTHLAQSNFAAVANTSIMSQNTTKTHPKSAAVVHTPILRPRIYRNRSDIISQTGRSQYGRRLSVIRTSPILENTSSQLSKQAILQSKKSVQHHDILQTKLNRPKDEIDFPISNPKTETGSILENGDAHQTTQGVDHDQDAIGNGIGIVIDSVSEDNTGQVADICGRDISGSNRAMPSVYMIAAISIGAALLLLFLVALILYFYTVKVAPAYYHERWLRNNPPRSPVDHVRINGHEYLT